ncbi:hypothetical protein ACFSJU_03830 [Paradesertivirga mongoliensis]|uniref:Uncharacterized protein n=1 Tax=Paradesertivirga mongoliensis TaxID=2100740 RepID=A0ABW4ZI49_9SPHI|nr:hypothetical protein [Pedobacter mongoliensis]
MKLTLISFILIAPFFTACNSKKNVEEVTTEHVVIEGEELYEVIPPPPEFKSDFDNLDDWLTNICENEPPTKPVKNYNFGLFESPDEHTIFFVGLNKYTNENSSSTRVDYEPENMYFVLPKTEYSNLSVEQVKQRLTMQLKEFVNTTKFKSSYLAEADSVTTDFGGKIWPK